MNRSLQDKIVHALLVQSHLTLFSVREQALHPYLLAAMLFLEVKHDIYTLYGTLIHMVCTKHG